MSDTQETKAGRRKERQGVVVSKSGDKSVVVLVQWRRKHPVYGKVVRHSSKFHAHDEKDAAQVGDKVLIVECRPLSKMKRWRIAELQK